LHLVITIAPLYLVETVKSDYEAVRVTLHVFVVGRKDFAHFIELSLRYCLHHVLPIFGVVEKTTRLAGTAKLV
jgi:hypothetical protein